MSTPLLQVTDLVVHYGAIQALKGVSCHLDVGEIVAVIGANGAGKTTLLRALSGLTTATRGQIRFDGHDLTHVPAEHRVGLGLAQVAEGRKLFGPLSVEENLRLGTYAARRHHAAAAIRAQTERVYSLFPILHERRRQKASTLSGGQQQMLAIGRALLSHPRLLLLDEPSLGLAPKVTDDIFDALLALNREGLTICLVEQNAMLALDVSSRCYALEVGRVALASASEPLRGDQKLVATYLGGLKS